MRRPCTQRWGAGLCLVSCLALATEYGVAAAQDGKGLDFALAVSDARWGRGRDVSDLSVLEDCAEAAGWDAKAISAAQNDSAVRAEMARHRGLIAQDGVFGVPFAVMGAQKYWGHDRFDLLVADASGR